MTGLVPGTYFVRTNNLLGYIDGLFDSLTCIGTCAAGGTPIVIAGTETKTANFALVKGSQFKGTVTNTNGDPLANVTVNVYNSNGTQLTSGTTNDAGKYTTRAGVPPGTYAAKTFNSLGYIDKLYPNTVCTNCSSLAGNVIEVTSAAAKDPIDFVLPLGGKVTGRITDAAAPNGGLADITVNIHDRATSATVTSTRTNAQGNYTAQGIPTGTNYTARTFNSVGVIDEIYDNLACSGCSVSSGIAFGVTAGATTPNVNFDLAAGGRISGKVTDKSTPAVPIVSASVSVFDSANRQVASTFTNLSGDYTTSGLLPGTYYVKVAGRIGFIGQLYSGQQCVNCSALAGTAVTVTGTSTTPNINFSLDKGGTVTGRVVDAASGNPPIDGVTVFVYDAAGDPKPGTGGQAAGSGVTLGDGTFTITGLPTDQFTAKTSNSRGYINQVFQDVPCVVCSNTGGTPKVQVNAPSTTSSINFTLTKGGSIEGTVTDTSNPAVPLAGVAVGLYTQAGQQVQLVTTDAQGKYKSNSGLAAGNYFVKTSNLLGYVDKLYDNAATCAGCSVITGTPVVVNAGAAVAGINFALAVGGQVTGTVTSGGTPLENITVNLNRPSGGPGVGSARTNAAGFYRIIGVGGGSYVVRTSNDQGYTDQLYNGITCVGCNPGIGTQVSVTTGLTTNGIDFSLIAGGRIAGTIKDPSGLPIVGVTVNILNAGGVQITSGNTDAAGRYKTFGGLPTGIYYARTFNRTGYVDKIYNNVSCLGCLPTTGTPISVTSGSDTTAIDFTLALGGRIAGTVTDSATSAPLSNATVDIFTSTGIGVGNGISDYSGRYITSSGYPAGKYYARATNQQGYIPKLYDNVTCSGCAPITGTAIEVTLGSTKDGINFALAAGARITGAVTDAASGVPLVGVNVTIFNSNNNAVSFTQSDVAGQFRSGAGLPAGTYYARTGNGQGYVDKIYNDTVCLGCRPITTGTAIVLAAGETKPGINFALNLGGRVSGTVTDQATGQPLAGVSVNVVNDSGFGITGASTDSAGQFVTNGGVPTGNFFVRTFNNQGYVDELYNNQTCLFCDPKRGDPVAVTAGATTPNINFGLVSGGRIAGKITSTDTGAPIGNVRVAFYSDTGNFVGGTRTNGAGDFLSPGLPAGNYMARTFNPLGFVEELYNNITCSPCPLLVNNAPNGQLIAVTAGGPPTSGINMSLATGGIVSGYITDAVTGAPIQGGTVSFFKNGQLVDTSSPSDGGGFYIASLPAGTGYTAQANPVEGYTPVANPKLRWTIGGEFEIERGGETGGVTFPLTACIPPDITPTTLPTATRGVAYSRTLAAAGSNAPYTFSISDGLLPPGLSLTTATGVISGTPTTKGTANFTVAAIGANGCSATQAFAVFTCGLSLTGSGASFTSGPANGSVGITSNGSDCGWTASTSASWITLGAASGAGSGTLNFTVAANASPTEARSATIAVGGQAFTVTQGAAVTAAPFGVVDTPSEGATNLTGSIGVTGWALDDLQVSSVEIWRDPVAGEGASQIFIGNAVIVDGARPDVQAFYPTYPFNTRAGWGYLLLTNFLPNQGNGTVTLYAYAKDIDGKSTLIGTRTITTANATATVPFGAIDTPGQGATVSGTAYVNFGWALTPQPKQVPTDGSTIQVIIDGVAVGTVTYNFARSDIQALFPGYKNTDGAVGFRTLDTTTYADGVHTIAWVVTDDAGAAQGIGSRYFTVANAGGSLVAGARAAGALTRAFASAVIANAPTPEAPAAASAQGLWAADAATVVTQRPLDRLVYELGDTSCGAWTPHRVVNGRLEPLPFGASVAGGTFYWQPGVGYLGAYDFVFVNCGGSQVVNLRVVLQP